MTKIQASQIEYVDAIIIGGGIAGISIAEFLARHSRLSIKVLESASQLGTFASGKLEGWFHTGALYSGHDDAQTFINCVNSLEDAINLYSSYFTEQCNIALTETKPNFFTPAVIPKLNGWFNDRPVYLIHPGTNSPEISLSGLKSDSVQMEIQRNRVLGRLETAYGQQHNWYQNGNCLAPIYAQVEAYEGLNCSLCHSTETIDNLCHKFDQSYGLKKSNYEIIKTLDSSMNTSAIIKDLVASALSQGVTFETGVVIDKLLIDRYGPIQIKSLLCQTQQGFPKRLKAKLFIFAVGKGFEPFLSDLQVRAKLKRSRSAMVVAQPALTDTNFVRMSTKKKFHFNHFVHSCEIEDEKFVYSMLADSSYTNDDLINQGDEDEVDIEPILESAERYFGKDRLYNRNLFSYECVKTEFISQEEQKRRYSYWIESNPHSNYLCVLPGKFSFFPTVAFQVYQRIKTLINFDESVPKSTFTPDIKVIEEANKLVADSYPMKIITEARNCSTINN
ncbi:MULTISPECIES: FAD-dependent oxidoreductase [Okeania]|uniref:FAD-dependent oxidoreductase n=1 Tax=Okeania TaxID=1458928 RepID=UPI000F54B4F6|nr:MULTISPECIES: FAD-dependent oxidoreductase [Okeania]NET15247.1 FAD-dependent oxidoreductase [Okeania sp. SIO1H6]NES74295.1 FAD-dependent oxidoreductase [Okeania sp. SIO1H4]NET18314.1 FAD-dependent oxidoreductase [Okeania sp. SIO1H5]NET96736.1 FAD-dependent oxidoreductase [Okeania sp. SIO1H2]RQH23977.1 FAD-dependent oxidoreductase [Okeania hirsuta]